METLTRPDTSRQLVTLETVTALSPIENADFIAVAKVRGWNLVVKKDEVKAGDKVLYFEIDSLLPLADPRFAFLEPRGAKTFEGVYGHVLKSARMRGIYSQGLVLPASLFPELENLTDGEDIATVLRPWCPQVRGAILEELADTVAGAFPTSFAPKRELPGCRTLLTRWGRAAPSCRPYMVAMSILIRDIALIDLGPEPVGLQVRTDFTDHRGRRVSGASQPAQHMNDGRIAVTLTRFLIGQHVLDSATIPAGNDPYHRPFRTLICAPANKHVLSTSSNPAVGPRQSRRYAHARHRVLSSYPVLKENMKIPALAALLSAAFLAGCAGTSASAPAATVTHTVTATPTPSPSKTTATPAQMKTSGSYADDLAAAGTVPQDVDLFGEVIGETLCESSMEQFAAVGSFNYGVKRHGIPGSEASGSSPAVVRLTIAYFCPERAAAAEKELKNLGYVK